MTASIENLVKFISTAQAAYADFSVGSLRSSLESSSGSFTQKEADKFVDNYSILGRQFSAPSGLQAVLFQSNSGRSVLAIRGSQQILEDFGDADFSDIGPNGFAISQAVDLYRYWKMLTTPSGVSVSYSMSEVATLWEMYELGDHGVFIDTIQFANDLLTDKGIGALNPGDVVDVTGHSLGGNLAYVFASMFPNNVGEVVTINAPGINRIIANGQANLIDLGFWEVDSSKVTSINAEGDKVHLVSGTQPGKIIDISQEVGHGLLDDFANNHSVTNGLDGLNLMQLFTTLDPSQQNNFNVILSDFMRASSNQTIDTYENMLDGLRRILLGDSFTNKTAVGDKGNINARNELYNNMDELNERIVNGDLNYLVGNVKFIKVSNDPELAKKHYSHFLSLYYLAPFVLSAQDSDLKLFDLTLYQTWYKDVGLSAEDRNNGKANFSDSWYRDRTAELKALISRNTADADFDTTSNVINYVSYRDADDNVIVTSEPSSGLFRPIEIVRFGDDKNNSSLVGYVNNDRLYGDQGDDVISGKEGHDYLDGGVGNDLMYGGDGADQLYGGKHDDTLIGEEGNDLLFGGDGTDTYKFNYQFGRDVIRDADGIGSIEFSSVKLTQLTQSAKDSIVYYDDVNNPTKKAVVIDEGNTKSLIISTVTKSGDKIIDSGNSVTIKNWTSGSLGIQLNPPNTTPEPVLKTVAGDNNDNALYPQRGQYLDANGTMNPFGNYAASNIKAGDGKDYIGGSYGSDQLYGGNGNDWIAAESVYFTIPEDPLPNIRGADTIDGGDGDDVISGRAKNSIWHGGKGRDMLLSNASMNFGEGLYMPSDFGNSSSVSSTDRRDSIWRDLLKYTVADYKVYRETKNDGSTLHTYSAWAGIEPGSYSGNSVLKDWTCTINLNSNTPLHDSAKTSGDGVALYNYFSSRSFINFNADFYYVDPADEN